MSFDPYLHCSIATLNYVIYLTPSGLKHAWPHPLPPFVKYCSVPGKCLYMYQISKVSYNLYPTG